MKKKISVYFRVFLRRVGRGYLHYEHTCSEGTQGTQLKTLRGEIGLRMGFFKWFSWFFFDDNGMNIIPLYFVNILFIYLRRNCEIFKFFFWETWKILAAAHHCHYLKSVLSYILEATDFIWNQWGSKFSFVTYKVSRWT